MSAAREKKKLSLYLSPKFTKIVKQKTSNSKWVQFNL